MNRFEVFRRWAWSILIVGAMAFALGGCSGDDGRDGADGQQGPPGEQGPEGPAGPGASITPLESCAVCHDDGSFVSAPDAHAVTGVPAISNVVLADVGGNVQITYNLLIDGAAVEDFTTVTSAYIYTAADGATNYLNIPDITVVSDGGGDYTATVTGGTALAGAAARFFLRVGDGDGTRAIVSGDFPAAALPDIAADASCGNCHGPKGLAPHTAFGYPGMDASDCVTCHKAEVDGLGFLDFKDSWVGLVHGIHNAHDFPDGVYEYDPEHIFDTTYPTYMLNCSVCHSEAPQLAAANAMTVSGANCFTCHGSMDGWDFTGPPDLTFHNTIADPETADCTVCHDGATAPATVADFHNGLAPAFRRGPIFNGEDVGVTEGAKFDWQITGIVDDGVNLAIDWVATYDGVGVDPCNDTVAAGAPAFHNIAGSNLSMLRSYAQGDDFIIGMSTSAPGQPLSESVTVDNTTCAANIATTTIPVDTLDASIDRGIVALQGRPWVVSPLDPAEAIQVRAKTPTYEWMVGDGAAPLVARRDIVDTSLCLSCHVGSLYMHGGNRIDNAGMCILCHNSAANEQNVRTATMGIDPADTYDGQVGETYELKSMLHAIHSANYEFEDDRKNPPLVIYRGRGVYAFAPDDSLLPNWPGTGSQTVFGSTIDNEGNPGSYVINHNFHAPTYPRLLNDCAACHVAGLPVQPDQTKAMATTVEAGSEDWDDQIDDVLQGATSTACITCHADAASKGHAYQNSWDPQEFPEGRQTIIDAGN